jgi:hypothetical protein
MMPERFYIQSPQQVKLLFHLTPSKQERNLPRRINANQQSRWPGIEHSREGNKRYALLIFSFLIRVYPRKSAANILKALRHWASLARRGFNLYQPDVIISPPRFTPPRHPNPLLNYLCSTANYVQ